MKAKEKITNMLKTISGFDSVEVAKGNFSRNGDRRTGWHYRKFGRSEWVYIGANMREVDDYVDAMKSW